MKNTLKHITKVLQESKEILTTTTVLEATTKANKNPSSWYYTHSEAVQAGLAYANSKGYDVDDDEWFSRVAQTKKPSNGKTVSLRLELVDKKTKEPVKNHMLIMQVYRDDAHGKNSFELNCYIS